MFKGWAAQEAGGRFSPFEYDPGPLQDDQVEIGVSHCGICHSDLSMLDNAWGMTQYPLVPGHEVAGHIRARGEKVEHLQVGQAVGLGWHSGYCMTCPSCMQGDHNLCATAEATIVGRHGGFADKVRARAASVVPLPDGIDTQNAGPLFCGGITVFTPILQSGLKPTDHAAVIGIGGLGHMALQFLKAWGCEVTAFTSSDSKKEEALKLGAHKTLHSRDPESIKKAAGSFDLVISTVNVKLDWNVYIETLKPRGRLHLVGAVLEPLDVGAFPFIMGQRSLSGSPVGSPANIARMLEFAARHQVRPVVEVFPIERVNEAMEHLRQGKARYRIVLDLGSG
jgi:uncharacterized zinc-type alcohol dehydrogenase-like protein